MESMKLSLKLKNQQTVEPALDLNWQHLFCSCPLLSWLLNWEQHDTGGHLSLCKVPNVKCLRVPALGRALEERNKAQCFPSLDTVLGVLPVFTPVSEPVSTALRALGCGHQCQPCSAGSSLKGQRVGTAEEEWGARGSRNREESPSEGEGGMWGKGAS